MAQPFQTANTILRRKQVEAESGLSRSTIYLRISQGLWPHPVSLGGRAVGWPAFEVSAMNGARIEGKTNAAVRTLVQQLEAARPGSASQSDPNTNPRLQAGRARFIADVRAGKRPAPRSKASSTTAEGW